MKPDVSIVPEVANGRASALYDTVRTMLAAVLVVVVLACLAGLLYQGQTIRNNQGAIRGLIEDNKLQTTQIERLVMQDEAQGAARVKAVSDAVKEIERSNRAALAEHDQTVQKLLRQELLAPENQERP